MPPHIGAARLGLPDARGIDTRQHRHRAIFGAERHVGVRLGHHRRLARDRIAQHRQTLARARDKRIEAIERIEARFERGRQAVPLAHPPSQEPCRDLAVVAGLEIEPGADECAAHAVVVGQ